VKPPPLCVNGGVKVYHLIAQNMRLQGGNQARALDHEII